MLKYILLIVVIVMIVPVLRPHPTHAKSVSECKIDEKPGGSGLTREVANKILQIESHKCICIEDGVDMKNEPVPQAGILAAGECEAFAEEQPCTKDSTKSCCILSIDFICPMGGYTSPGGKANPDPMEMVEWAIVGFESPDDFTAELQFAE